jgi:hypothetical protein
MSEQYSTLPSQNEPSSKPNFLQRSYSNTVTRVQDGVSYIRGEITEMYNHSTYYLEQMALPVNNFLKDFTQIDSEFSQETSKDPTHFMALDGKLIPVEQILSRNMEENY